MPFNLGPMELILVMVVLLLLFGAKRLPELGSGLGRGIREFKRSISDIKEEVTRVDAPSNPNQIHNTGAPSQVTPPPQAPVEQETFNKS
ncbi:MAG TPA: twin-arginine translocase TatA/TatE family subunit [Longimicrobiales bacterium]|nr:twin-arginine translocase TatA/TatE family subunit [Longimicrobiales bacterium]